VIVRYTTADCCKVMAAWVRSVMTGRRRNGREKEIEAWWVGWRSHELVSQEGRVVTGCFRMTNFGGGLRPAAARLENGSGNLG